MAAAASTSFTDRDFRGARFTECDLSGVTMRAVDISGADIDAPWLLDGESTLLVNGVDVAPYVEAQLNARFPGRDRRRAETIEGLREAWAAVEQAWQIAIERVATMPPTTPDISVDGEWSFAQTLRHLVMATDIWLRGTIQGIDQPYHPIGQPHAEYATDGHDPAVFDAATPSYATVLAVRAERVALVRDFIDNLTPDELDETRPNPWAPEQEKTVRACLHTIVNEEWEHLRFALRDLDAIPAGDRTDPGPFFHGTKADLDIGDLLEPGRTSNFGSREIANFTYLTATLDAAVWGAELALGDGRGRIYEVAATGPVEADPNLTNARFPGNPTRSYRSRDPLRVVGEVTDWEGHPPEVVQQMRDRLAELARQGVEAINE